jgi:hypothetical protein
VRRRWEGRRRLLLQQSRRKRARLCSRLHPHRARSSCLCCRCSHCPCSRRHSAHARRRGLCRVFGAQSDDCVGRLLLSHWRSAFVSTTALVVSLGVDVSSSDDLRTATLNEDEDDVSRDVTRESDATLLAQSMWTALISLSSQLHAGCCRFECVGLCCHDCVTAMPTNYARALADVVRQHPKLSSKLVCVCVMCAWYMVEKGDVVYGLVCCGVMRCDASALCW